jgi:hypothetical protein
MRFFQDATSVLGLLFGQHGQSFYTNEIIKSPAVVLALCNVNCHGWCAVALLRLSESVRKALSGQSRIAFFQELCSIMSKTVALVEPLKTALQPFLPNIELAFVYGSVAKGEDTASSDIDLMIISDSPLCRRISGPGEGIGRDGTPHPANPLPAELAMRISTDNAFVKRVLAQPKIWILGGESELPTGYLAGAGGPLAAEPQTATSSMA